MISIFETAEPQKCYHVMKSFQTQTETNGLWSGLKKSLVHGCLRSIVQWNCVSFWLRIHPKGVNCERGHSSNSTTFCLQLANAYMYTDVDTTTTENCLSATSAEKLDKCELIPYFQKNKTSTQLFVTMFNYTIVPTHILRSEDKIFPCLSLFKRCIPKNKTRQQQLNAHDVNILLF